MPNSSARRSTHGCETHSTRSGSTIERSWHAISDGEVKSSTWCTVRITWSTTPSSRSASAALADRQSCAWTTSKSRSSDRRPSAYTTIIAWMRSSNGASSGTWRTSRSGTPAGRNSSSSARASANSSTSWPRRASASATSSACTTPPRGLTE